MDAPGTLEFDNRRYLDGRASDPRTLGWMEGAPPPEDKRILFAQDRFLEFPQIRWSLSHMRELVPTVNVWRGDGEPARWSVPSATDSDAVEALTFTDMGGRARKWQESLDDTYT